MKRTTRIFALILVLCLLFSVTAFAQPPYVPPRPSAPFPEIIDGLSLWWYPYVNYAYDRDWVTGIEIPRGSDNWQFQPTGHFTRAQAVAIFARMADADLEEYLPISPSPFPVPPFPDVPFTGRNAWAAPYVAWARENNIVEGRTVGGETRFFPNERITRQDFAVMMIRFAEEIWEVDTSELGENEQWDSLVDLNAIGNWARIPLRWANSYYLITGDNNRMRPRGYITRREATAMIVRMALTFEPTD